MDDWVFWGGSGDQTGGDIGKHSWGQTALVGLQLSGPLHSFISVFAQGMCPNLHMPISERSLHRAPTGPGMKATRTTVAALLIPPRPNLKVIIKGPGVTDGSAFVGLHLSVGGMALIIYTKLLIIIWCFSEQASDWWTGHCHGVSGQTSVISDTENIYNRPTYIWDEHREINPDCQGFIWCF